jgi:hypothetical protein
VPDEEIIEVTPEEPDVPDWQTAPPPRRAAAAEDEVEEVEAVEEEEPIEVMEERPRSRARRNLLLLGAMVVVVGGIIGVVLLAARSSVKQTEETEREKALQAWNDGRLSEAQEQFKKLQEKFPSSEHADEYKFLIDLANLRTLIASPAAPPDSVLDGVKTFLDTYAASPLLQEHARDIGQDFTPWLVNRADALEKSPAPLEGTEAFLTKAREALDQGQKAAAEMFRPDELAKVNEAFGKVTVAIAKVREWQHYLAQVKGQKPTADGIKEARRLIAEEERRQHGFAQDAEVQGALTKLREGHFESVHYFEGGQAPAGPAPAEDLEPSLVVRQHLEGVPPPRRPNDPVVLALVRGVLYALSQTNGEIVWAMRVGIDTANLPVRVPASGGRPEMVLALSADTETLTALDAASGRALWRYRLSAPCLGQPIVVGLRAYVPTYDGRVHEVELAKGQLLGHYELGQHLTLGGTRQPQTDLLYLPADDLCVYVLDVRAHRCQGILYSDHPSGSLRSVPLLVGTAGQDNAAGYLVLAQTDGLSRTDLKAYSLPIDNVQAGPPAVRKQAPPGWPWFPPYQDPEKFVVVTDAGVVGVFGIRQPRNQDPVLFPLVRDPFRLQGEGPDDPTHPSRAQVVACHDDALWVLAHGGLQKLNLTMNPVKGPQLAVDAQWKQPLALGSPLHRSQVEGTGPNATLFLVTQAPNRRGCVVTAVLAATKKVLWKQELGLVAQGVPLVVGQDVVALDQGGAVFVFHPAPKAGASEAPWQVGGQALARPLDDNPNFPPALHAPGDGTTVYEVACPGKGTQLRVRRFQADKGGRIAPPEEQDEKTVDLPSPPAGDAAVRGTALLVPLQDGTVFRVKLPDCAAGMPGPEWRSPRAGPGARCHVVWVNDEDFLTTDGGRGLTHWRWPEGKTPVALPQDKDPKDPTAEVRRHIETPPAVLPPGEGGEVQVCVADATGTLTLLRGERLEEARRWDLGGRVTAGPFVRGNRVGCVVDGQRLVWLDPARQEHVWDYQGGPIVGEPQVVEGLLVVAHQSGRFVGLDPNTGRPHGPGFALQASAAPACGPVPYGPGRAFAPLTDGTVLLLSLQHLRDPFAAFPVVW